jgi:hypothetical protein
MVGNGRMECNGYSQWTLKDNTTRCIPNQGERSTQEIHRICLGDHLGTAKPLTVGQQYTQWGNVGGGANLHSMPRTCTWNQDLKNVHNGKVDRIKSVCCEAHKMGPIQTVTEQMPDDEVVFSEIVTNPIKTVAN